MTAVWGVCLLLAACVWLAGILAALHAHHKKDRK